MGVSTNPMGAVVPLSMFSLIAIGPGLLAAPLNVNDTAALSDPEDGSPLVNVSPIDSVADPVPEAGVTCSHG